MLASKVKRSEEFVQLARIYGLWALAVWGGGALGWLVSLAFGFQGLRA